jgi:NAD-dependent protein deacetylase/lipoamidase
VYRSSAALRDKPKYGDKTIWYHPNVTLDHNLTQAAAALASAGSVAVLSGAGISKESGIPTFREAQVGLWARYNPEELVTAEAFHHNPDRVWAWYQYRRDLVAQAQPNAGHAAVAQLEQLVEQVVVVTQNVDGLHARAGSTDIVELHGSLNRFKCEKDCSGMPTLLELGDVAHDAVHAPHCPHCGAWVRPDVVWFGEMLSPQVLARAMQAAHDSDVMLVVGTSGVVQPAASLPVEARRAGATIVEVNPEASQITRVAQIFLQGSAGQVLPQLVHLCLDSGSLGRRTADAKTSEVARK